MILDDFLNMGMITAAILIMAGLVLVFRGDR
jgi:hypothetical protein